ncbi:cytochrome P450 [Actinoplanes sp. TBRC 11911]|uniref:cytochrome P450 family protein n=1 Tax=Actinoplanes sp. TBRC 11911 TaxID=2729386 RepID=UPI00145E01E9|nr:cytochrome P450 [Actinoplanes sp. TBRC 11911]NMO53380.1 cytochrome P450 [Actinoplanes sp. TBRC 11911]
MLNGNGKVFGKNPSQWAALRDGRVPADWLLQPHVQGEHMLHQDGAPHRRLRRLVSGAFTPARVDAQRPWIARIVDDLLDSMAKQVEADIVPAFAEQLPVAVTSQLLGVPVHDRHRMRGWTRVLFAHTSTPGEVIAAAQGMVGYLHELVELKRRTGGDDLTTALVEAHDGDALSARELIDSLYLLLIAGHETAVHMLGQAVVNLLTHPAQLALAIQGNRWADVVEETLRLNPPVTASAFHYALRDTELAGVTIPAGDAVVVCIGGAATDPDQHGGHADRFDIDRERREHLSFGHGPHYCLGAPLARVEGQIALARLFERFPDLKLTVAPHEIRYSPSLFTYGPLSVPVSTARP